MWKLLVLCFTLVTQIYCQLTPLIVNTTQGEIEGYKSLEGDYYEFYGIRYGAPTRGQDKFKTSSPAPWSPTKFIATERDVHCAQPGTMSITAVEDCLRLNIFTKNTTIAKPVLVLLEGEDYISSHMTLSFKELTERDILVVKLNYRISIFGFLCLRVPEAQGNAGLKDIILALQWIQNNIANFGGDPKNVILLGHGSGAALVDLIPLSPLSEGLVHKVIALSGSVLAPWALAYDPIGYAQLVAARLAYTGKSPSQLATAFASIEDMNLLSSALEFEGTNNTVLFAPCIEDPNLSGSFLTDAPINLLRTGNYNHIDYLAGFTDREGTIRVRQTNRWPSMMKENFTQFIQVDLDFSSEENKTKSVNAIRNFYFGNSTDIDIEDYLDYHGDTAILVSVLRGATERARTSKASVYLFEFAYRGTTSADWAFPDVPLNGVRHGGILNYIFGSNLTAHGMNAMNTLLTRIVRFANTGMPNGATPRMDQLVEPLWLPITNETHNYLHFGGPALQEVVQEPRVNPHTQRMQFWNGIYDEYYKEPPRVSSSSKVYALTTLLLFCILFLRFY